MSEHEHDGLELRARVQRVTLDRDVGRRSDAPGVGAPTVGKCTLTEGISVGYTERDSIASLERSLGEARAQLAALASAVAARARLAAVTTASALRRSLRMARDHLGSILAPGLAERQERLAELEARAARVFGDARDAGLLPPEAERAGAGSRSRSRSLAVRNRSARRILDAARDLTDEQVAADAADLDPGASRRRRTRTSAGSC